MNEEWSKVIFGIILPCSLVLLSLYHARIFYPRQSPRNVTLLLPQSTRQESDSRSVSYMCRPSSFLTSGLHCFLDVLPHRDVSPPLHSSPLYLRGVQPVLAVVWSSLARLWIVIWPPKFLKLLSPRDISPSSLMLGRKAISTISLPSPMQGKRGLAVVVCNPSLALHETWSTLNLKCAGLHYNSFFF